MEFKRHKYHPRKKYDVVALSAVVVDMQMKAEDADLQKHGLKKGLSNLVDKKVVADIESGLTPLKSPGGPGVNVASGVALRGGKSVVIGKIANDENGKFITQRFAQNGVQYTPTLSTDTATGTTAVHVLTTPDKERSFAFAAGASMELGPEDVDEEIVKRAKITYLDSYLWLTENGKEAVHHAADVAKKSGGKVAIALNDAKLIEKNRTEVLALVKSHGDILVGDMKEFQALFGTTTPEDTMDAILATKCTAAVTMGKQGAYVAKYGAYTLVPTQKLDQSLVVDTNGAGDQFASGFIYGIAEGKDLVTSAQQGAAWAADVIQHFGAEPQAGKNAPKNIQNPPHEPGRKAG